MKKKIVIPVPPRPELIRIRYAPFLEKQARKLEKYKKSLTGKISFTGICERG